MGDYARGNGADGRPLADQIDNTYVDKQLTEEEEAEWNDLFEAVIGGLTGRPLKR